MINQLSQCNYSNNAIIKICKAIIIIEIMITMNNNKIIQYVFQKKNVQYCFKNGLSYQNIL